MEWVSLFKARWRAVVGPGVGMLVCLALGACSTGTKTTADTVEAHYELFRAYGLPTHIPRDCSIDELLRLIYRDKYRNDGLQQMGLVQEIGVPAAVNGSLAISVTEEMLRRACIHNAVSGACIKTAAVA